MKKREKQMQPKEKDSGHTQLSILTQKSIPFRSPVLVICNRENICAFLSETGVEVCRLLPKIQKIREVKNALNSKTLDICFSPCGKMLACALDNSKLIVADLASSEKTSSVVLYQKLGAPVKAISWTKLGFDFDAGANPFVSPIFLDGKK